MLQILKELLVGFIILVAFMVVSTLLAAVWIHFTYTCMVILATAGILSSSWIIGAIYFARL